MYYAPYSSSSFTGKSMAANREIATVRIITLKPDGIVFKTGKTEKAKLKTNADIMQPATTLFCFAGGIIIAKNIP